MTETVVTGTRLLPSTHRRASGGRLALAGLFCWLLAGAAQALQVTVDTAYIDVHSGPGRGYPAFHVLERGERVTLLRGRTEWVKIATRRGLTGWVQRSNLAYTLTDAGQPPALAGTGRGDFLSRRWELGAAIGDFDGADSLTLTGSYRFTEHLATELRLSQNTGQFSDSRIVSLGLLHQPFPDWRVSPFFTLGAGQIRIRPNATLVQSEDREDNLLQAGIGTYIYLSRRFFMRVEYTNHLILTSRDSNEEVNEWKLGFSIFF
jgi:hypothetical protein